MSLIARLMVVVVRCMVGSRPSLMSCRSSMTRVRGGGFFFLILKIFPSFCCCYRGNAGRRPVEGPPARRPAGEIRPEEGL